MNDVHNGGQPAEVKTWIRQLNSDLVDQRRAISNMARALELTAERMGELGRVLCTMADALQEVGSTLKRDDAAMHEPAGQAGSSVRPEMAPRGSGGINMTKEAPSGAAVEGANSGSQSTGTGLQTSNQSLGTSESGGDAAASVPYPPQSIYGSFGAPSSAQPYANPSAHVRGGHASSAHSVPQRPAEARQRPSLSLSETAVSVAKVWTAYYAELDMTGTRFSDSVAQQRLEDAVPGVVSAVRRDPIGYLIVHLSQHREVLVMPTKSALGISTPYLADFYHIRAELAGNSSPELQSAAIVALANLAFPPAHGAVERGTVRTSSN